MKGERERQGRQVRCSEPVFSVPVGVVLSVSRAAGHRQATWHSPRSLDPGSLCGAGENKKESSRRVHAIFSIIA